MCLFLKGCGIAHFCFDKTLEKDDPTMTVDGIKALDTTCHFDEYKELLADVDE